MPFWATTKPDHAVTPRGLLSTSRVRGPPARMSSPFTVATKRHLAEQHQTLLRQQFLRFILSQSGCGVGDMRTGGPRTQATPPARMSSPFTVATKRHLAEQHQTLLRQQFLRFILSQSGSVPVTCGPEVRAPGPRTQSAHPACASGPRIRPAYPVILTLHCAGEGGKGRQSTCLDQRQNRRYKTRVKSNLQELNPAPACGKRQKSK
jgi:hypothetical protein